MVSVIRGSDNFDSGASGSTFGAVGTYIWGRPASTSAITIGSTSSGLYAITSDGNNNNSDGKMAAYQSSSWVRSNAQTSMSGTWRHMGGAGAHVDVPNNGLPGIWIRIS
jgi:hypothetical protein